MMEHSKKFPLHIDIAPIPHALGKVRLPGSKSISNRSLLLSALATGTTKICDLLDSDDTMVMLSALQRLGVHWQKAEGLPHYHIAGTGGAFPIHKADLFVGNAGTVIRPLTATLAVLGGEYTLHGVARMHERPIGDLVDALNGVGANISYTGTVGYPPLHIRRGTINAHSLRVRGNVSSQFLTALLIVAPFLARQHTVHIAVEGQLISRPYIEITLNMMRTFGVVVQEDGGTFVISPGQLYQSPGEYCVEGDASSASYFLAAGAISGGPVRVEGVGRNSIQGDVQFAQMLEKMGATIKVGENWIEAFSTQPLQALDVDCNQIPDAAMTLAVVALYADGPTTLRNIGSWRVKETDRLSAMATELRKLGALVDEGSDWLRVCAPKQLNPAEIKTYDDHRMAMCFSLASLNGKLRRGTSLRILDPGCVAKTFPEYFEFLEKIRHEESR